MRAYLTYNVVYGEIVFLLFDDECRQIDHVIAG